MQNQTDEGVDLSHALDQTKPGIQPAPIKPSPIHTHKKLVLLILVVILLAFIQGLIWYYNRPPVQPPHIKKVIPKSTNSNKATSSNTKTKAQ